MMKNKYFEAYHIKYLMNLHYLINEMGCHWEFIDFDSYNYINGTNLKANDFTIANAFLLECKDNKIELAKNILSKGVYFPFFYFSKTDDTIEVAQGKHRVYSFLLYQKKYQAVNKKFLWIEIPQIDFAQPYGKDILSYFDERVMNMQTIPQDITNGKQLYKYLDRQGGSLSAIIKMHEEDILPSPILNNEELFKQFITTPLDENNIIYKIHGAE